MTKFYRITPADLEDMSLIEVTEYLRQMDEYLSKSESG